MFAFDSFAAEPDTTIINLKEITISASQNEDQRMPITVSTISSKGLKEMLGNKNFAEAMRNIPSVYATSESGSYGDAKMNIRGFKQENINVMLNGIPISGLYTGSMFWNNWIGLSNATYSIQLQKGIGGSMIAANSVGGTVNIITQPTTAEMSGEVSASFTDYGNKSINMSFNTGEFAKGWAISFSGSHTGGPGYVDATYVNSFAYMLNVSKKINDKHSLLFTALGSPDKHGQRSTKLSAVEVEKHGLKYNRNWGEYGGKINNISENNYHKPFFSLNHYFKINENTLLTNTIYYSIGKGGGKWTETTGKRIIDYMTPEGQIDWYGVYYDNMHNTDVINDSLTGWSKNIQSDYQAGHSWAGLKSNLNIELTKNIKLSGGIHYQYFYSWQREQITDLLGGQYWYENYAKNSLAGVAGRNPIKNVGDYIRLNNGHFVNHGSIFVQNSYDYKHFSAFIGGMIMTNIIQRWDKYNYINDYKSQLVAGFGGNVKAGVNWKINDYNNLYLNAGWNSKVPYYDYFFSSNNNNVTNHVRNEKAYIAEIGYNIQMNKTKFNLNGYYTYWKDKAIMSDKYKQLDDNEVRYMIQGLNAEHVGIEATATQQICKWLTATAFVSIGNWKWKNNVSATIYNNYSGKPIDTLNIYTKGLYVGDAPQSQIGLNANARIAKSIDIYAEWRYNDRMYADFDPSKRTNPNDNQQSFRIPSYHILDLYASYSVTVSRVGLKFWAACNNALDSKYIERGDDGKTHDLSSFRGFWGIGRNFNFGIRVIW